MKYEQYSPSIIRWNHEYPTHWSCEKAKRFFANPKKLNKGNEESNVLSLTLRGVIRNNGEKPIGLSPSDYNTYQIFDSGELVFKLIDLNNISTSRVGMVPEKGIMSSAYIRFVPRADMNIKYFYYQYYDWYKRNIFNGLGEGVRQTLSGNDLRNLEILIPPREEQDQIVRYLDWQVSKINKLIAAKKHEIQLLEEERQVIIDTFVLRSLHEKETKVSSLSWDISIPLTWNAYKFNQIFNFGKGLAITKANLLPSGTPVISYGQVHSKTNTGTSIDDSLIRYVSEDYIQSAPNSLVHEGDFIFADTSEDYQGVGNCVYVDRDDTLFAGYHTVIARPKDKKARRYLSYLFLSSAWRYSLRKQVNGVKVYSVTQRILKNTCVILPPEDEQAEIVTLLDAQCARISVIKQKFHEEIERLQELRTRLVSDVVTGQIDVRGIEVPDFDMVGEIDSEEENLDDEDAAEETEEQEE
ncbi:type I restriction modification DNA specificity domain protein [Dehalococcoides mccartyi]|uniref:Type I restriction modification DNA specificity domain protein n=1 Tax=Dehalococcoides mccartyi TaxID=61435 RepID=A0AB33HRR8_9CHLR|nr:restriction endonuclease subunit S [Dehalococcoides mccartyi]BAZ97265.1 type I restriction modification DNA specificity domain protein [Dehalococcoides mccartyi]